MRGLLGVNPRNAGGLLGLLSGPAIRTGGAPIPADAADEHFLRLYAARGGDERVIPEPAPSGGLLAQQTASSAGPARAPQRQGRERVSGWRVFDRVLGGQTISEGLDAERERLASAPLREASRARMARLQSYVDTLDPALQLAFESSPEKLGEAFASRGEAVTLRPGDVRLAGREVVYGAPFDAAPGSSIFDPTRPEQPIARAPSEAKVAGGALVAPDGTVLYRGPEVEGVAATADAYYTPEIARGEGGGAPRIVRQSRPETVTVQPGGEIVTLGADGQAINRVASTQQRPLTATDRNAIREDQDAAEALSVINDQLSGFLAQVEGGDLNLGPLTNMVSGARNFAGRSDQNSRNFASFRAGLEKLRNDSLRLNNGVQTEGDSQRAWNELLANINDEGVVRQRLAEIMEINRRAMAYRQARIEDRGGAAGPGRPQVSREAAIAELRRRGRL